MTERSFGLLGSGEFEPWSAEVDQLLLERARRSGAGKGRVLILPAASAPEGDDVFDMWADMGLRHYGELEVPAEVVPLKTREDAERVDLVERLSGASMVFFSGGNPAYLAKTLAGTAFWLAVLHALDRGVAFAGCSAGVACLSEQAPDSSAAALGQLTWTAGLRLFEGTDFAPHWDMLETYVPGLTDIIVAAVPDGRRLVAIDERTALVGDGAEWEVVGTTRVHVHDENGWLDVPAGQRLSLPLLSPTRAPAPS